MTYLVDELRLLGGAANTFEQARRLGERGHTVRVLGRTAPPSWLPRGVDFRRVATFSPEVVPESDFVIGTDWTTVPPALGCGRGLPVHYCRDAIVSPDSPNAPGPADVLGFRIATSRHDQLVLQRRFEGRCWYVHEAVDLARFRDAGVVGPSASEEGDAPFRILIVGESGDPSAGVSHALDAVAALRRRGHRIVVTRLAGGSPQADELATGLVDEWRSAVTPDRLPSIYRDADVFLGVSLDATASAFLPGLEAMAAGVPVVLTDIPCHHGYASGSDFASFVPAADAEALADAVERLATDPDHRRRQALAGQLVAGRYSWESHLDHLEAVLDEIHERYRLPFSLATGATPHASSAVRSEEELLCEHRYAFATQFAGDRRVLDVGCGRGDGAACLARSGARSVLAVDASEIAIAYARRTHEDAKVTFSVQHPTALDLDDASMDLVLAFDLMDDVHDADAFVEEAARVLTDRGALLVSIPNVPGPDRDHGSPSLDAERDHPMARTRALLERRFGHVVVYGQAVVSDELVIRPESVDGSSDVAYLYVATQLQRQPADDGTLARETGDVGESGGHRRAA